MLSVSYMACTASTYGAASLTNRSPDWLTMMQPGSVRSARQKYGPRGSGIDGPHQASSITSTAAPSAIPASIPSPMLAEYACGQRAGLDGAATRAPTRRLRVVVGVAGHPGEPQRGVVEDESEHLRPALQERLLALVRRPTRHDVFQVPAGLLRGVPDPRAGGDRGVWYSDP